MSNKARVGMIGLRGYGNMVRGALKESGTLELAAIWSRSPESIADSQRELPSKVCESYEALLEEPIDGVLIINPNHLHVEYGLKAAEASKSILVEKPITNTVAEARQLIDAFRSRGVLLAVKHQGVVASSIQVSSQHEAAIHGGCFFPQVETQFHGIDQKIGRCVVLEVYGLGGLLSHACIHVGSRIQLTRSTATLP